MNEIERELLSAIVESFGGVPEMKPNSDEYFSLMSDRFPTAGSKVDWSRVPGAHESRVSARGAEIFRSEGASFFREARRALQLADDDVAVIIGDSAMDFALLVNVRRVGDYLHLVLDLPQHTYVVDPDAEWCVSFTMEGDLCFGRAPRGAP